MPSAFVAIYPDNVRDQPHWQAEAPRRFDVRAAHPARMWNFWLGGKDHFAADRAAAAKINEAMPLMPTVARTTQLFATNTVREVAGRRGIRQFLDIGTGLPVNAATHEVAQSVAPDACVVYVDNDPVVICHAQALLVGTATGSTECVELDLRHTSEVLAQAAKTLDFEQPMLVLLSAVLHFIPDADDPWEIVDRITRAIAPGSYLLITHAASDIDAAAVATAADGYNQHASVPVTPRDRAQVTRFFDGLTLTGPGVVPAGTGRVLPAYFGLGRKARLLVGVLVGRDLGADVFHVEVTDRLDDLLKRGGRQRARLGVDEDAITEGHQRRD